jgi:hypothetical protein
MEPVIIRTNMPDAQAWVKAKNFANQLKAEKAGMISDLRESYDDVNHTAEISGKAFGFSATFGVAVSNGVVAVVLTDQSFLMKPFEGKIKSVIEQNLQKLFA